MIFTLPLGDGDSSVTKRLHEISPYGRHFHIKKIECRNHLMRNYCSKLTALSKITKYSLRVRKYLLSNIQRFRSDVTKSVKHWRNTNDTNKAQKIKGTNSLLCELITFNLIIVLYI
jgi:hypothetical protein